MILPTTRTTVQTRYSDTDALGHFSNSSYVIFLEVGRLDFFKKVMDGSDVPFTMVVVNINVDIMRECVYGDHIEVTTRCTRIGTKSMVLTSEILANGNLVSKGTVTLVAFDVVTRQSVPLPSDWQLPNED